VYTIRLRKVFRSYHKETCRRNGSCSWGLSGNEF